ncbi:hypothetical protein A3850_008795 [Lewinella sp. 4G2]|nr:hypothetical protein A3850_008795 [Lewinella sp. 4G2]
MDENTPGKARGISVYDFFPADGELRFLGFVKASNPSYLVTDRSRQIIYVVHEHAAGEGAGVTAHKVKRAKDGKLSFGELGSVMIDGADPCHLAFAGRRLVVSCYTSGQVMILPLAKDGSLSAVSQTFSFTSETKRTAHAHCAVYQPDPARLLVADLGADRLRVLNELPDGSFDHDSASDLPFSEFEGPRHVALHPSGKYAVVNGECKGTVRLVDVSGPTIKLLHQANALPERVIDEAHGAAIRFGGNGKMIYVSDRNFSVVNALRLDERAGQIRFRHANPSGGDHPRDLILSPDGEWLITANTKSSNLGVFRVDPKGELTHYRTVQKVPTPTTLGWL